MTSWIEAHNYMNERDDEPVPDINAMEDRIRELECRVEDLEGDVQAAKDMATEMVRALTPGTAFGANRYGRELLHSTWRECRPLLLMAEKFLGDVTGVNQGVTP